MAMKCGSFDLFAADEDDEDLEENWDTSLDEIPFMKLLSLPDLNKPPPAVAVVVPPSVVSDVEAAAAAPMFDCFMPFNFAKACTIDVDMDSSNHVSFVPDDDYQCQEKGKDDIGGTCEMNMAYEDTPEAFFGPDSQPISSASPTKPNAKRKYNRTKMKKHRPKVVNEGTVKKNSIPITPTKVTPRRATTKGSKPIKSKIVKNRKQSVAKSCKRVLMFDDTVKKALCTSDNISLVEEINSGLGLKRDELKVESLGGKACGLAGYENGINIDLSVPPKLEIVKQSKPIQVYKRKFRCLITSRKVGPNFPTKRRSNRQHKFRDTKEEGLHDYPLTERKRKRKGASLVKAKKKKLKVQEDPFMCLVSIRNSAVNIKRQKRSTTCIPRARQNFASIISVLRRDQSPPTPFKSAPIVNTTLLTLREMDMLVSERQGLNTIEKCEKQVGQSLPSPVENVLPSESRGLLAIEKCKKTVAKKQGILGQSIVNVGYCFSKNEALSLTVFSQPRFSPKKGAYSLHDMNPYVGAIVKRTCTESVPRKQRRIGGFTRLEYDIAKLRSPEELLKATNSITKSLDSLHLRNEDYLNGAIVKYDGLFDPKKTRKVAAKVNLDEESIRMWNLLMIKDGKEDAENMQGEDKRKWWEDERKVFRGRIDSFIARMHLIQGDRRFSRWKGSVVDSVVGVFLTQNVSDHLSSSAFMSLVAKYPISLTSSHEAFYEDINLPITQESLRIGMAVEEHAAVDKTEEDMNSKLYITNEIPEQMSGEVKIDEDSTCGGNKDPNTKISDEEVNAFSMGVEGTTKPASETRRKEANDKDKEPKVDWDKLRKLHSGVQKQRSHNAKDSVDWNAVKNAKLDEVADTIKKRGQHFIIAGRIKDFLDRVAEHHGSIDLEWLRDVPEDDVKEFLLSVCGLGLKSVECIRLLALEHIAFPVDTNVGRIAVRLGWVPLQPLPEEVQIHLLNAYPLMDSIQKYLWPRLCKLDQRTLYELHYQMITFGKVFCTKRKPNCNPCPMRGECRHFASAFASARLALPGPKEKRVVTSIVPASTVNNVNVNVTPYTTPLLEANSYLNLRYHTSNCEPIIEEPTTPEPEIFNIPETDIEDLCNHDDDSDCDDIPTIKLNLESFATNILGLMEKYDPSIQQGELSKALVAINDDANSTSRPKLKYISRLRTQHQVFELPDSHPLLTGLEKLEPDDPSPYLLAIWMPGDTANSMEQPKRRCNSQDSGTLCDEQTCFPCNFARQQDSQTVHGTLLIPCRTAMRGRFPLNGTYFQVNEVFSDYETSLKPLKVPTSLIWNLRRRTVYCGTSLLCNLQIVA